MSTPERDEPDDADSGRPTHDDTSAGRPSHADLVDDLQRAVSQVVGQGALFSLAVAERLGLAETDVASLEVLSRAGRLTAGRLAELTGLTSGAATRMIDRLEQAGFVRRSPDPTDRRRVVVQVVPERMAAVAPYYASLQRATDALAASYADADLAVVVDYLGRRLEIARTETARLRGGGAEDEVRDAAAVASHVAPMGPTTSGRLVFLSGAPNVELRADAGLGDELYRAQFEGPVPRVRLRDGVVNVSYARLGWLDWRGRVAGQVVSASVHWRKDRGAFVLNATVPWTIELRGGVSRLRADLRDAELRGLDLRGGSSQLDLQLPVPKGPVAIRIVGGIGRLTVHRPTGVALTLKVVGGAGHVSLDGQAKRVAGVLAVETPGGGRTPDRYEIQVTGGASSIAVDAR